jgi:hypothetical protein
MKARPDDGLEFLLGRLATPQPDEARSARTRQRCHERLTRASWHERLTAARAPVFGRVFEPAAAVVAATLFLGDVILRALRLYGVLPTP